MVLMRQRMAYSGGQGEHSNFPPVLVVSLCHVDRTIVGIDISGDYRHHIPHIRPSGVRPLNHPERAESLGLFFWGGV
jgi:hypothetical protein